MLGWLDTIWRWDSPWFTVIHVTISKVLDSLIVNPSLPNPGFRAQGARHCLDVYLHFTDLVRLHWGLHGRWDLFGTASANLFVSSIERVGSVGSEGQLLYNYVDIMPQLVAAAVAVAPYCCVVWPSQFDRMAACFGSYSACVPDIDCQSRCGGVKFFTRAAMLCDGIPAVFLELAYDIYD